uniref:Uncharacterized protein n=1 Tax=Romanomermis culicivorax TaxID=13658 RepID=A0A915K536_ROMCU
MQMQTEMYECICKDQLTTRREKYPWPHLWILNIAENLRVHAARENLHLVQANFYLARSN